MAPLSQNHPGRLIILFNTSNEFYVGGEVEKISTPNHYDYRRYRLNPDQAKKYFKRIAGIRLLHSKLEIPCTEHMLEMTIKSMEGANGAKLFLHPVVRDD